MSRPSDGGDVDTGPFAVTWSSVAKRDVRALPRKIQDAVLSFADGELARSPHRVSKPLRGDLGGYRSARRGTWRIMFQIYESEIRIHVVRVAHRGSIYR